MSDGMSLERAIEQQISLGHTDPHEFPDLLKRALGEELVPAAMPYLDDWISEMARHRLGALRRAAVAKITPENLGDPKTLQRSMWVPSGDGKLTYKVIGQMTPEDFDARAEFLERLVHGVRVHAQWCRECAERMRSEGVRVAKKLSALPPLPELVG